MRMMDIDEPSEQKPFLETKTRTELESDLERCLERKRNLEEEKNALHNLRIDLETMLKQREEELSVVKSQLESLQSKKETVENELRGLKELRSGDENAIEDLGQKISHLEQEGQNLKEETAKLKTLLEQALQDKEKYKAYSDEAEKHIELKTEKLMTDLREMQQLSEQYKMDIQEKDDKIRGLEEEIERMKTEKGDLEQQMLTRKDMHIVNKEFLDELGIKLEDLKGLVQNFGAQVRGGAVVEETGKRETSGGEMERLLEEPEHIDVTPGRREEPEIEEVPEVTDDMVSEATPEGYHEVLSEAEEPEIEEVTPGIEEVPEIGEVTPGIEEAPGIEETPETPEELLHDIRPEELTPGPAEAVETAKAPRRNLSDVLSEETPRIPETPEEPHEETPPESTLEEKLWEEPEPEITTPEEEEPEPTPEPQAEKEKDKFPWEDEEEDLNWGF